MTRPVRILHTADWHAGKTLMGRDRTPEIREALGELAEIARSRDVDLVLVAGDVFDNRNPTAEAEAAVYDFFGGLHEAGIPSVVIAGNHDSPRRLDAVAGLLRRSGATVVGEVRTSKAGGIHRQVIRGHEVRVAALPFASERRLLSGEKQRALDDSGRKPEYRRIMGDLILDLSREFSNSTVNLLLMHGTMEGARLSRTEYEFHSSEHYVLGSSMIPGSMQYLALGHIHDSQPVQGLAEYRGRYSGSLIQLDFGEADQDKFAWLVDLEPGRPAETVEAVTLESGRKLREHRLTVEQLESMSPDLAGYQGWLKLKLLLDEPRPGLRERVMRELPNVMAVTSELRGAHEAADEEEAEDAGSLDLAAEYARYHQELRGKQPSERLTGAFRELQAVTDDGGGTA